MMSTMSEKELHEIEHRQQAFRVFKAALETLKVCAGCACSGLLYVGVSLAQQQMKISWEEFVRVAKIIWDDVALQQSSKKPN